MAKTGKEIPWSGTIPTCDICRIHPGPHDAPTLFGPWANMCDGCLMVSTSPEGRAIGTTKIKEDA